MPTHNVLRWTYLTILLCGLIMPRLPAQTNFGRISGSVTDPSGALIPGAAVVVVTNVDTQASRNLTTDERGFYVAENLQIGPYSVAVEYMGFKRAEERGLSVISDGHLTADFHLQIGDTSQAVEVTEVQREVLNTVSGEIAHVVDSQQIDNLALNGRNTWNFSHWFPARW